MELIRNYVQTLCLPNRRNEMPLRRELPLQLIAYATHDSRIPFSSNFIEENIDPVSVYVDPCLGASLG